MRPTGLLRRFAALEATDRLLFVEAWLTLGVTRAAVSFASFPRVQRWFPAGNAGAAAVPVDLVGRVAWSVAAAARYTPWSSNCLARALAARRMLRRRRLHSELVIGVKRPGDADLEAHAWLTCGGILVSGGPTHEQYSVLSAF